MSLNFYSLFDGQYVPYFKNGHKIHIKKANRGKFTEYCGGKVTDECIQRGKNSSDPKIRKRATFAANARKWSHKFGGKSTFELPLKKFNPHSPKIQSDSADSNYWMSRWYMNKKKV